MTPPESSRSCSPADVPSFEVPLGSPVRVRDQGELVAAIPALIGFHPRDSLVLVATGGETGGRIGLTLRMDLPTPERVADVGAAAVRTLLLDAPVGAVVLVVAAGDGAADGADGADPPHGELVGHVLRALQRHAVHVHAAMWAHGTTAGSRWRCYDPCGCSGVLPDPASSPVLAAAVAGGQVVHADRAALEQLVAPAAQDRIRRREELLVAATDRAVLNGAGINGPGIDGPVGGPGGEAVVAASPPEADLGQVDAAIADAAAGRLVLDDARIVALATALTVPAVRDAALLRCAGPLAAAAEQLWVALARETPDPEAAEPAALLAVSALLRGDGALANVALDRAEGAWPGHRLTALLRIAAESGVRPAEIRAWLTRCEQPRLKYSSQYSSQRSRQCGPA